MDVHVETKADEVDPRLIDAAIERGDFFVVIHATVRVTPAGLKEFALAAIQREAIEFGRQAAQALCREYQGMDFHARVVVREQNLLLVFLPTGPRRQAELWPRATDKLTQSVSDGIAAAAKALADERKAVLAGKKYVEDKKAAVMTQYYGASAKKLAEMRGGGVLPAEGDVISMSNGSALPALSPEAYTPLVRSENPNEPLVGVLTAHSDRQRTAEIRVTKGKRKDQHLRIKWDDDPDFTRELKRCYEAGLEITVITEYQRNIFSRGGLREAFQAHTLQAGKKSLVCNKPRGDLVTLAERLARRAA